jgi:3-oxoacyl-[acyl-carrier protein] reductase
MNFNLTGKTVLVCGGSSGIGLSIAKALAKHVGIQLIIVSSNSEKLQRAKDEFETDIVPETYKVDLSNKGQVEDFIGYRKDNNIGVDILINNSGGPKAGNIFEVDTADWDLAIQGNFLSHVQLTKHCLINMQSKEWGRIINITSTLASEPTAGMTISASVRASMSAFSKAVSDTVCKQGISINTICPGGIETERLQNLVSAQADKAGESYETTLNRSAASIPKGRFGLPDELASLAEYLCCEEAEYITGRTIAFDGSLMRGF